MQNNEFVRVVHDGNVAEVTIDRPKALNALNVQVLDELESTFIELAARPDVRCVFITGVGKSFVAGADIAAMSAMTPSDAEAFCKRGHAVMRRIETFDAPVIAAVNGFALGGGCELALACDIIVASEDARFGQPEVALGLIPGFGGTVHLARKVGYGTAALWISTGDVYDVKAAQAVGLVQAVYAKADLLTKVRDLAKTIAKRAPLAVRAAKRSILMGLASDPVTAGSIEQLSFAALFGSHDMREGTTAFVEKREPTFTGN